MMTTPTPPAADYDAVIRANCHKAVAKELVPIEETIGLAGAVQAALGYVEGLAQWCEDVVGISLAEIMRTSTPPPIPKTDATGET